MQSYQKVIIDLFKSDPVLSGRADSARDVLGDKKIILYGAGSGLKTFSVFVLNKYGFRARAVLDKKFKDGVNYFGLPAFSPDQYYLSTEDRERAVVVITVGKKEYHEEIFSCLRKLGFKNIILSTDLYEYHSLYTSKEIEARGFNYYLENKDFIIDAFNLFSDDLSKETFIGIIKTHIQRKPIFIPNRPLAEQYFPQDINLSKGYSHFIDCGAYDGDTVRQLNTIFGRVDSLVLFEPDLKNFDSLSKYLGAHCHKIAKSIVAFPCGVYSRDAQLKFSGGNETNSSFLSNEGSTTINCVALDHVLPGFKPTHIKMDVEGSESEALKGAETLIRANKPDLAISVYHISSHIWEIPLYLNSLNLGYRFYLRNYTSFVSETILYATV